MIIPSKGKGAHPLEVGNNLEGYYKLLFENSPIPMWVVDTDTLCFLMVNDAAEQLYGYTKEEFLQMTLKDIRKPDEIESFLQIINFEKYALHHPGEWVHVKKDNSLLYVEMKSNELPGEEGTSRRLVVVQDMTSRVTAERKLKETESLTSSILQNITEVIFSFNERMEMSYISPQCHGVLGYRAEDFYRDKFLWFNLILPEDQVLLEQALPQILKTGNQMQVEYRIKMASGQEKWVITRATATLDDKGKLVRIDGSTSDITDRKEAEERLRFADFTIERASEAFLWTRSNAQILRVNKAACALLGFREEELLNQEVFNFSDYFTPENWEKRWTYLSEKKSLTFESAVKVKGGSLRPVEVQLNYFTYGNESFCFSCIREISDRKKAETEKAVLTEEAVRQNQHLQQFAYIVSHNLKAPVANIVGLVSLYNRENPADPLNQMLVNKLERTSQRLDSTINDLNEILTIRSKVNQNLEEVCLQEVLSSIKESLSQEISCCQASVTADFSGGSTVLGVKGYVHSIFFNLISNAIKYRSANRGLQIHIKTVFSNGLLCLLLQDNGLGIDLAKQRHKVFGLYRRFHSHTEGKGLGLHMTKTQVESIGGKIDLDSTVDVGTTFKVFFQVPAEK